MGVVISFDLIQAKIERCNQRSWIIHCLGLLNRIQSDEKTIYPFWRLLVILKWALLYSKNTSFLRNATPQEINELLALVEKFESGYSVISFSSKQKIDQFFRILAYQQFVHQDHYSNSIIDRQIVLYSQLSSRFDIAKEFEANTGISLINFFNYCYLTFLFFHLDELKRGFVYSGRLEQEYFKFFQSQFGEEELQKFLVLLTIQSSAEARPLHRLNEPILQLYETDFFTLKPFLLFEGRYQLPHRSIFLQTVSQFVYLYMKERFPQFPEALGTRMENYLRLGLAEVGVNYLNEKNLRRRLPVCKVVDYQIEDDILVEVKATSLHPRAGILRSAEVLRKDLETTIIKAYKQLLTTANALDRNKSWYGIVVTYKEMYLGFGLSAWKEFLQVPIQEFASANLIEMDVLPPENLFFLSIRDWDWIMQAIKGGGVSSVKSILLQAQTLNHSENPIEQVFMMEQVLRKKYRNLQPLSYLETAHSLLNILPKS